MKKYYRCFSYDNTVCAKIGLPRYMRRVTRWIMKRNRGLTK